MSTLKVNNLQVGQDGTAANNYTLYQPASPDGTVRLGYGVAGSVTDILTLKNSRLGIGTDNPQGKLVVSDGANGLEFNPNSNSAIVSYNRTTSAYAPNGLQGSTVQLRIGGVGTALHVHSNGNVGIGTESPSYLLHTKVTTTSSNYIFSENTTVGNAGIRLKNSQGDYVIFANADLRFYDFTNNKDRFRIDSSGNIILGYDGNSLYFQNGFNNSTARIQNGGGSNDSDLKFYTKNSGSEAMKLKIESGGATTMHVNSASHETFRFTTQGVNEAKLMMKDDSDTVDIQLNTGGSSWFQGGNLAVGHNSPDCRFHVRKDSSDTSFTNENTPSTESGVKIANLNGGIGTWTALTLSVSNGSATQNGSIIAKSVSGGTTPEIHIGQRSGNTTDARISINSSGFVGISNDAPTRHLSVSGNMNLSSGARIESYSSGGNLIIQGGSTYPGGHLKMYGGTGGDKIEFCTSGGQASSIIRFRLESNGSIRLTPEGSTSNPNARIDTSGDYLRLVTMKDGSGGCGFKLETQDGGAVGERFTVYSNGKIRHSGGHGNNSGNLGGSAYYRIVASQSVAASSNTTFVISGLASGWMTIRAGGYSNAGQSQFALCYQLGGYMTATSTYNVETVQQWGNGVTISVQKNASDYRVTLTNNSGSYALSTNWCIEGSNDGIKIRT